METCSSKENGTDSEAKNVNTPDDHDAFFASRKLCCSKDGMELISDLVRTEVSSALSKLDITKEKQDAIVDRVIEVALKELENEVLTIRTKEQELNEVLRPKLSQMLVEVTAKRKNIPSVCRDLRQKTLKNQKKVLTEEMLTVAKTTIAEPPALEKEVFNLCESSFENLSKITKKVAST